MKEEKREIRKVGIFSVAKIFALFGVLFGIMYGIQAGIASTANPLSFSEAMSYATQNPASASAAFSIALGWWAIIVAPIVFAIGQFITGLIGGLLYNWFARMVGGVKIYLN